jgi:SPOR domain
VNIVGQTGGQQPAGETQVAAADPAPAPAAGAYSIQIASTPSPEAAKSTYAALSRKFGGVIGGKGVNIQKANVEGKGTVYRVRIPAGSKQDATALCSQYKSAGGSCFVTR